MRHCSHALQSRRTCRGEGGANALNHESSRRNCIAETNLGENQVTREEIHDDRDTHEHACCSTIAGNGSEAVVSNHLMPVHQVNHEQHNIRHVTVSITTQQPPLSGARFNDEPTYQNAASRRVELHVRTIGPTIRDVTAP